ncbi:hypothetical protein J3458_020077 [Metarhizium acridum]|uniref:uncharacterized protein n=1 Tax=Metarhizium acridum TaxID=92637 RepID=UPI001C6AB52B|nr:hypothetical protein J3458_020077 [Metarhizium acridum]
MITMTVPPPPSVFSEWAPQRAPCACHNPDLPFRQPQQRLTGHQHALVNQPSFMCSMTLEMSYVGWLLRTLHRYLFVPLRPRLPVNLTSGQAVRTKDVGIVWSFLRSLYALRLATALTATGR